MQQHTILDVAARDHVDDLRRQAQRARLAAKARKHPARSSRRSR